MLEQKHRRGIQTSLPGPKLPWLRSLHLTHKDLPVNYDDLSLESFHWTKRIQMRVLIDFGNFDIRADIVRHEHPPHFSQNVNFGTRVSGDAGRYEQRSNRDQVRF